MIGPRSASWAGRGRLHGIAGQILLVCAISVEASIAAIVDSRSWVRGWGRGQGRAGSGTGKTFVLFSRI